MAYVRSQLEDPGFIVVPKFLAPVVAWLLRHVCQTYYGGRRIYGRSKRIFNGTGKYGNGRRQSRDLPPQAETAVVAIKKQFAGHAGFPWSGREFLCCIDDVTQLEEKPRMD